MMTECIRTLTSLLHANSIQDEAKLLGSLQREMINAASSSNALDNLTHSTDDAPTGQQPTISKVFQQQKDFDSFISYVFTRRFGWSEDITHTAVRKRKCDASESSKSVINEITDNFIRWLLEEDLSELLLVGLTYTFKQAHSQPVVRHQTVIHTMDWIIASQSEIQSQHLSVVFSAVLLGLTDVWSAIRNTCVSRLSRLMDLLTLDQLRDFFQRLVQICNDPEASWQAKEGAIAGINTAIRRFQWVSFLPTKGIQESSSTTGDESDDQSQPEYFLRFGIEELTSMPAFISDFIQRGDIFLLLSHPQLSIREHTIKAFSSYITRSEFKEALTSLKSVVEQLRRGSNGTDLDSAAHSAQLTFLDAYKAEGLLGICVNLVKHISPSFLLPDWPIYFNTFSAYLMHPASTVRQSTSTIFKFIVAKGSASPSILRLVLQGLSSEWTPDETYLTQSLAEKKLTTRDLSVSSFTGETCSGISEAWQWREGRLLAYELVCQFLVKNHRLYTFGSSYLTTLLNSPRMPSRTSRGLNVSANDADLSRTEMRCMRNRSCSGSSQHAALLSSFSYSDVSAKPKQFRLSHHGSHAEENSFDSLPAPDRSNSFGSKTSSPLEIPGSKHLKHRRSIGTLQPQSVAKFSSSAGAAELSHQSTTRSQHRGGRILRRMPTMSDYSASVQTLTRHYSYYKDTTGQRSSVTRNHSDTMSLLRHTRTLEQQSQKSDDRELKSFSEILPLLLGQTVESLDDGRWEVRRMGQQLFACLVEVFLWYDMRLLHDLWMKHITDGAWRSISLMTYTACWSLQLTLQLASNLQNHLGHEDSLVREDHARMKEICSSLQNRSLPTLLGRLVSIVMRPTYDKLSVVAMHSLVLAHTHFDCDPALKSQQLSVVFAHWFCICKAAHSVELLSNVDGSFGDPVHAFSATTHGFLSCCTEMSGAPQSQSSAAAKQVEKQLLADVLGTVPALLRSSPPMLLTAKILPLIVCYLRFYCEMDNIVRILLECAQLIVAQLQVESLCSSANDDVVIKAACRAALSQFSELVKSKNVDVQMLRQSLEVCSQLLVCLPPESNVVKDLLTAISTRSSQISHDSQFNAAPCSKLPSALNLNHVTVFSTVDQQDGISEEEEEQDVLGGEPDVHILNLSGGGGGRSLSPPPESMEVLSAGDGVGASSDWDESDWSSEDGDTENHSALRGVLAQFLTSFKSKVSAYNNSSLFDEQIAKLQGPEKKEISNLLSLD